MITRGRDAKEAAESLAISGFYLFAAPVSLFFWNFLKFPEIPADNYFAR